MERELIINGKKLKELVSSALKTKYENISFEFNNEEDFAVEIKYGHFKEYISFSDERILKELDEIVSIKLLTFSINFPAGESEFFNVK